MIKLSTHPSIMIRTAALFLVWLFFVCVRPFGCPRTLLYVIGAVLLAEVLLELHIRGFLERKKKWQEQERELVLLQEELKKTQMASSAKGQFLSRMSHEIRTPLNAVIGYMNIAMDEESSPSKIRHCVENSEIAARHLLSIINDVLDISSIESGRLKIAHEDFDLKAQLSALTTLFYHQAKEKKVTFEVQLQDLTQEWVIGDSLRLNQILMNLLSNAMKFTPEGGSVRLAVTQLDMDENSVSMRFEVTDTGIGMSQEYQQRLFQPFEQESAATARRYGGTGLGLAISYQLIQMMGGTISLESQPGQGSIFCVTMQFERSRQTQEYADMPHDYSHVRALVVDDDQGSCEYMKNLLRRCKVKCDVVMDGESAIKQIRRRAGSDYAYNMCILDWSMPGLDGIETATKIREVAGSQIPIMIATAYDVTECEEQAKAAGIDRVIAKPLFQSTMFDLLVSAYGKYRPQESEMVKKENLGGLHVLLAEDNPMNLEIAQDILEKAGVKVTSVMDGAQAVSKLLSAPTGTFDLILMDVQMPVMDGYQATAAIRASEHPEAKTIPIIAMTANAFAEDVTAAIASGMNDHIAKPIDYDKLFLVLRRFQKGEPQMAE